MNQRQALEAARRRLMAALAGIADDAARLIGERCPYRAVDDRCTYAAGCRNQRRTGVPGAFRCSGARLNSAPCSAPEVKPGRRAPAPGVER